MVAVDILLKIVCLGVWLAFILSLTLPKGFGFFNWHPILMITAFVLLMCQGVVAYISWWGPLESKYDRSTRRLVHGVLQLLAGVCALAGYVVVFTSNMEGGVEAEFAIGSDSTTAMHVWFGYATLLLVLVQCVAGIVKVVLKARDAAATCAPWHGTAGPVVFVLGCITAGIGSAMWFQDDSGTVTGQGAALIAGIAVTGALALIELCFLPGVTREQMAAKSEDEYASLTAAAAA